MYRLAQFLANPGRLKPVRLPPSILTRYLSIQNPVFTAARVMHNLMHHMICPSLTVFGRGLGVDLAALSPRGSLPLRIAEAAKNRDAPSLRDLDLLLVAPLYAPGGGRRNAPSTIAAMGFNPLAIPAFVCLQRIAGESVQL